MENKDSKSTQIKNSILMIIGMAFLVIGTNDLPIYLKYTMLVISISAFLYLLFGFAKDATKQIVQAKKDKLNK
jgi:hypothetical protein